MVDRVNIGEQIHTLHDSLSAKEKYDTLIYNENHIISILLNKLPSLWSSFANGLRNKIDSLNLRGVYTPLGMKN